MTVAMLTMHWCVACGGERDFDQPLCTDGHGPECPEWFCLDCGYAVVLTDFDQAA